MGTKCSLLQLNVVQINSLECNYTASPLRERLPPLLCSMNQYFELTTITQAQVTNLTPKKYFKYKK